MTDTESGEQPEAEEPREAQDDGTADDGGTADGDAARDSDGAADDGGTADDDDAERRYKRLVAISLAVLAVLAATISVIAVRAGAHESRTTREATRLAAEAETATVLESGALAAIDEIAAEAATLALRQAFVPSTDAGAEVGIVLDPARDAARLAAAEEAVAAALEGDTSLIFDLQVAARRLTLQQAATVEERVTWNAVASQYETVLTVLAVAIFLVGFVVVVGRKLRPPLAIPAFILAVYCVGWATHIFLKPIPDVPGPAIDATAEGQALLENDRNAEASAAFTDAIAIDDEYLPAYEGRALASFAIANPDAFNTIAFTGTDQESLDPVLDDLTRSLELGGDEDVTTLTLAGFVAVAAGDYDRAAEFLESAVKLNPLTPGVQFALSAVELARGNEAAAIEWRTEALALLSTEGSDANRASLALYYTLLERVAVDVPEQADAARRFTEEAVALGSEVISGRELRSPPGDASLSLGEVDFANGETTIDLGVGGVPEDDFVAVLGYERPSVDGSWVQPPDLAYFGPPQVDNQVLTVPTPRNCEPVEYRFDLYVEGELVDSLTAPGNEPTC